jgi:hypothetical protein
MFPKIDEAFRTHNISTDILDSNGGDSMDKNTGALSLSGSGSPADNVGTAIHESAHQLDRLSRAHSKDRYLKEKRDIEIPAGRESAIAKFLKSKPAAKELLADKNTMYSDTTDTEKYNRFMDRVTNDEIPNFADYSFPEGEFKSDMIRDPLNVQQESGEAHHIDRNQTYDNMIKAIEDDGSLDRVTENDRFKKLRGVLA